MPKLLAPADLFGALISERAGEQMSEYVSRLGQVAENMTLRDRRDPEWERAKETEISARAGANVTLNRLEENELRSLGTSSFTEGTLLTWEELGRLAEEEPFRPIRRTESSPAGGPAPRLGRSVGPHISGVGSPGTLEVEGVSEKKARLRPGWMFIGGQLFWICQSKERVVIDLPPETTETVLPPFQIDSKHPHRWEAQGPKRLKAVAADHEHTYRLTEENTLVEENPSSNQEAHTPRFVGMTSGPVIVETSDRLVPATHFEKPSLVGAEETGGPRGFHEGISGERKGRFDGAEGFDTRPNEGWTVADLPEGTRRVILTMPSPEPVEVLLEPGLLGMGPPLPASKAFIESWRGLGSEVEITVRAEDEHTGGVPGERVIVEAEAHRHAEGVTGSSGRCTLRLPASSTLSVTASLSGVTDSSSDVLRMDPSESKENLDGYGFDYGESYGS